MCGCENANITFGEQFGDDRAGIDENMYVERRLVQNAAHIANLFNTESKGCVIPAPVLDGRFVGFLANRYATGY